MFFHKVDEEISLKLLTTADAGEVFWLIHENRHHLRKWLGWVDHSTHVSMTKSFIEHNLERFAKGEALDTGIYYREKLVGKIGFNKIVATNKTAEIGYLLDRQHEGKGIMTRAAKAMIDMAFDEFQLNKVEIRVATGNVKSRAIPERLGLVEEGTLREAEWLYDHYVDHVVYGVLKREWMMK